VQQLDRDQVSLLIQASADDLNASLADPTIDGIIAIIASLNVVLLAKLSDQAHSKILELRPAKAAA